MVRARGGAIRTRFLGAMRSAAACLSGGLSMLQMLHYPLRASHRAAVHSGSMTTFAHRRHSMISRIEQDHSRFREIIRGRIRKNLRKYISRGDMIAPKSKGSVSIPMPQIKIPRFSFGSNRRGRREFGSR